MNRPDGTKVALLNKESYVRRHFLAHGFSAEEYLNGLPPKRVRQIHLAGHSRADGHIIDTHDHPVAPEVWALYASACRRFPDVATMIERDDNIPPLATLIAELDQARAIAAQWSVPGDAPAKPLIRQPVSQEPVANNLHLVQRDLANYMIDQTACVIPDQIDEAGPLPGARGMHIYHHAYRERLTDVLADSYAKCQRYLGPELFRELADQYIYSHPPKERNLGRYGGHFVHLLATRYPDNPELHDLAQLEWALREVFDGADVPSWTLADIQSEGADSCLTQLQVLHPSVRVHLVQTNAVSIWRAIDADEDAPVVERWASPRPLAVWRKGLQPHFKSLDSAEAQFLLELTGEAATITSVAQSWSESGRLPDPATLGEWLASWWPDELLRRGAS